MNKLAICAALSLCAGTGVAGDVAVGRLQFLDAKAGCARFIEQPRRLSPSTVEQAIHKTCDFSWPVSTFLDDGTSFMSSIDQYRIDCAKKQQAHLNSEYFQQQFWIAKVSNYKSKELAFITIEADNKAIFAKACAKP